MKKLVIGAILGCIIYYGAAYGYRVSKPQRITDYNEKGLVVLNEALERLWDITNGRYAPNSGSAASTGTGTVKMGTANNANSAGWLKFEKTDGTVVFVPYWTDDTP
jgi:hypothetical protein